MIIVAGHLLVAASERSAYLDAVAQVAVLAREFPGCHDFAQSADPIDPERINIFERWDDDEALAAFRSSGSADDETPTPTPDIIGADVARYRISAIESP